MTFTRIAGLAARVPGIAWVILFTLSLVVAGAAGLMHLGASRARVEVTRNARSDSLSGILQRRGEAHRADSAATMRVDSANAIVHLVRARRADPRRRVAIVNDTSVTVMARSGMDSLVFVHSQIVTQLRDDAKQIAADSIALLADSVKFVTLAAIVPLDSAQLVLATRLEGDGLDPDPGGRVIRVVTAVTAVVVSIAVLLHLQ